MIRLFLYAKSNGLYNGEVSSVPELALLNIPDGCDFTLTPYPLDGKPYKWNGKEWEAVDADS